MIDYANWMHSCGCCHAAGDWHCNDCYCAEEGNTSGCKSTNCGVVA